MATVGTPVPPPVKNDWLSSALDNPKLSPPSPGGPRKAAPVTAVSIKSIDMNQILSNEKNNDAQLNDSFCYENRLRAEGLHLHQQIELHLQYQTDLVQVHHRADQAVLYHLH